MPRQTFLTRESFLEGSEKQARELLSLITDHSRNITFVSGNRLTGLLRYCYRSRGRNASYHIDISVLPLNDQFTQLRLHASMVNEEAFYENADMSFALHDMEAGIQAMNHGDFSYFRQREIQEEENRPYLLQQLKDFFALYFLKKKLS